MATAQLSRTPSLNGSSIPPAPSRSLSRTRGILLDTMQLVEPRKEVPVPNHLLESKIYSKVAQNSIVQARPAVIHFSGFDLNKTHKAVLQLANVSGDVQRMHIIPPQTKYFYVKYTKNDRLVPGLTLDCVVEFSPDEWRYYYDCIRIHTKGEENLIIPIHAYPVMKTSDFPKNLSFPPVPIGDIATKTIPLCCNAPVDFEFQLTVIQPHPAFTIDPLAGVIPANDEIDIIVTFAPTEFNTATMKVQLSISQFSSTPLVCSIFGYSEPGLAKSITMKTESTQNDDQLLDPRCISPLDRARSKRLRLKKSKSSTSDTPKIEELEYKGIQFPSNLDTPHAVAQVLIQDPGKLRMKDLREAVMSKKAGADGVTAAAVAPTRQMKEAMFDMAVRKDVYEERQNQLRWQVKLGEDQIGPNVRMQVLKARDAAWHDYKLKRGDPVEEEEYRRKHSDCTFRRTRRDVAEVAADVAQFDTYTNDMWAVRHTAISRFQQAARRIIIRARADIKILGLRQMMLDWGNKKFSNNTTAQKREKDATEQEDMNALDALELNKDKVTSLTFPTYAPPNIKDDMAVDALGKVPYKPTDVIVKHKTPYFSLKVPQQYNLLAYSSHNAHVAAQQYIPRGLARPLRRGADDEIITLHAPAPPVAPQEKTINEGDMIIEEVDTDGATVDKLLQAPAALFTAMQYPPLHIFNPAPNLQVFLPPLPYAETDPDIHLCPLPRYTSRDHTNPHMATQKAYLDREDVIRGVMGWKRFPSQGLTSLANTPTLTNVWVPRWNDAFSTELLPSDVPELYDGLADDDRENITAEDEDEEEDEESSADNHLTPEMVNAQFALIDPSLASTSEEKAVKKEDLFPYGNKMPSTNIPVGINGPVPREKREQELEFFLKKKYNRLGQRIQTKVDSMDNLKTNQDLVLK